MRSKRFRRGDTREDGKRFWHYSCRGLEYWVTAEHFERLRESAQELTRQWKEANPDKPRHYRKAWREANPERDKEHRRRWSKANPDKVRASMNKYARRRRATDPIYLLIGRVRCRLGKFLSRRGLVKQRGVSAMIGCSWRELREHIEKQFPEGMGWGNRGKWHIDHIVPLSCAKTMEDVLELSHYSNLRPIWERDNLRKSNSMPSPEEVPERLRRFIPSPQPQALKVPVPDQCSRFQLPAP
jgi:hypothetical protein